MQIKTHAHTYIHTQPCTETNIQAHHRDTQIHNDHIERVDDNTDHTSIQTQPVQR